MEIRIRAFRSIDEPESSLKFAEGHRQVLQTYGVTQVTSANLSWMDNPNVYVIIAESTLDKKAVGGARIHISADDYSLPIEDAVWEYDDKIFDLIKEHARSGTAELCGLWNSNEVAGMGIGILYLMRAGISMTNQLGLGSLFALCAQHTLDISIKKGFEIIKTLGENGTFYYPKEDLVATAIVIYNPIALQTADVVERDYITSLRENPTQKRIEITSKGELRLEYNLLINQKIMLAE